MSKLTKWLFTVSAIVAFNSCRMACTVGEGAPESQQRNPGEFNSVALDIAADVTILKGDSFAILIHAQGNLLEKITTKVSGGTLRIDSKGCIESNERIKITAWLPELEEVEVSGSGNVLVPDTIQVKNLRLSIKGSGDITGKFIAAKVESDIAGSGNINLRGSANKHSIDIIGSGNVNTIDFPCNASNVSVNGSGDVFVYAIQNLDISVNGSGTVHYKGKPHVNSNVNGSGKVVDEN